MKNHLRPLRVNYLPGLLIVVLLFIAQVGQSQKLSPYPQWGADFNRLRGGIMLGSPDDTFAIPSTPINYKLFPWLARKGDSTYWWSVTQQKWVIQTSGSSPTGFFYHKIGKRTGYDSLVIGIGDTSLIHKAINVEFTNTNITRAKDVRDTSLGYTFTANLVDSVYRISGKDSILFDINGRHHAIKDSSGASGTITGAGDLSPLFTSGISGTNIVYTLSNASPYKVLGRASGTGAPSYLSLDTTFFNPVLHTDNYYTAKFFNYNSIVSDSSLRILANKITIRWWFNVLDSGAVRDSLASNASVNAPLNTIAFNKCIAGALAAGNGVVYAPRGVYFVDSVEFPSVPGPYLRQVQIMGDAPPNWLAGTVASNNFKSPFGSIIRSLSTSPTASVIMVKPLSGDFSFLNLSLFNLEVSSYDNPYISGIDVRQCPWFKAENVYINTGIYNIYAHEPTHGTYGLRMPLGNNGGYSILRNLTIISYYTGLEFTEHLDGDNLNIYSCIRGLAPGAPFGPHSAHIGTLRTGFNRYNIVGGDYELNVDYYDTEHPDSVTQVGLGQTWQNTWADIYDPSNGANLNIFGYHVTGANGSPENFLIVGNRHIRKQRKVGHNPDYLTLGTDLMGSSLAAIYAEAANNDFSTTRYPLIQMVNTSPNLANGTTYPYNVAGFDYRAGNGAVIVQGGANYGPGATAPWSFGSVGLMGTITNHPFILFTNAVENLRVHTTGQLKASQYGAGSFTSGTAVYSLSTTSNGTIIETAITATTDIYNDQTGTTYTLQASDNRKIVTLNNASGITVSIPAGLPAGFRCTIMQKGAGNVALSPNIGVTLNNRQGFFQTNDRYSFLDILMYAADTFAAQGDMK